MIIEIKVANYRSINEEQTLSFVADRATRHPNNLIKRPGYRLLKAVGLFGANASGKSNFLKAIGAMSAFVRDSATRMNDGDPILAAEPYRLDPMTRDQPSRFEITFLTDGMVYTYGFSADRERVHEEWLTAKPENSEKELLNFHRKLDIASGKTLWAFSLQLKPLTQLFLDRTRINGLTLSVAARENVKELLPVYRFFRENIQTYDMSDAPDSLIAYATRRCKNDKQLHGQVNSLLRDADTGIESIDIDKPTMDNIIAVSSDEASVPNFLAIATNRYDIPGFQLSVTAARRDIAGKSVDFDFRKDESRGTNRLFAVAVLLLDTLKKDALIAIDELDASMHPLLTRRLLEMFQSPETNPNGAQLLFTTHDAVLLESVLFRRDQIVLTEKCDNKTQFYSLADVVPPPRNTEMFFRNYLAGRYGGTPYLGRAFSMVETPTNK